MQWLFTVTIHMKILDITHTCVTMDGIRRMEILSLRYTFVEERGQFLEAIQSILFKICFHSYKKEWALGRFLKPILNIVIFWLFTKGRTLCYVAKKA